MQNGSIHIEESAFNGVLSFQPLVSALKKNIEEGNPGMKKLYGQVVTAFEAYPELMEPIADIGKIRHHSELIEELLSAVFPPTTANFMYGVSVPFKNLAVYGSPVFNTNLLAAGSNQIILPENHVGMSYAQQKVVAAYDIILEKYFGLKGPGTYRSIYAYPDESSGLNQYMELRIDTRFIHVRPAGELPALPPTLMDHHTNRMMKLEDLVHHIPLENFVFEGIFVMRINDVTEQAVVTEIKNKLLHFDAFGDGMADFIELEQYVKSLIRIRDMGIGLTPFFKINGHYIYSDLHNTNSILFRHLHSIPEKDEISDYCKLLFRDNDQPLLFETLTEQSLADVQCLQYYHREGAQSLLICPLKKGHDLIGILEISSVVPGQLKPAFIGKVETVMPLFSLGLEKRLEQLNYEVDKVIKKKFTAVQPSVEWKFTEVALDYIVNQHEKEHGSIQRICFPDVWPLFAAIDIRNSSTERSQAIQRDILDQLHMAREIVEKAVNNLSFPLLQELAFKIDKFIVAASDVLQSEEEMSINEFMKSQVQSVFQHLHATEPVLKNDIEQYQSHLDPQTGMLYRHRKEYEQSVTRINETLSRLIDKEQISAQKVYPHYFERFVTDGLEFNMYMGQAISPRKKYDEIYLHNLRMWQLTVLAKAARMTNKLEQELSHRLRTTQLILSYSQQLGVTFRTEERKFDVDGSSNVRYEIIKKRIDKVRIRDTNERLTQPGKIAVVYTQAKDAAEYIEYIEFLQSQGLLKPGIEKHDLEELQGVIGLKALRVDVEYEEKQKEPISDKSHTGQRHEIISK